MFRYLILHFFASRGEQMVEGTQKNDVFVYPWYSD